MHVAQSTRRSSPNGGKRQFILPLADELVIDLFAGGGGASTGIEQAIGRHVDIAVNHDAEAVSLHQANHPQTLHYVSDVFEVEPRAVTQGQRVGLLWASPDCTFHSKARGGKPFRDRNKARRRRGLAWVVCRWAREVKPRVIALENVEEFQHWGPLLEDGKPCPERRGLTFRRWVAQLRNLGYAVEWRELRACDYGAPTIRKRLFLVARCDGQPIVWPEPTHCDPRLLHGPQHADQEQRPEDQGFDRRRPAEDRRRARADVRGRVQDAEQAGRNAERAGLPADVHHDQGQSALGDGAPRDLDRGARCAARRLADQPPGRREDEQCAQQSGAGDAGSEQRACSRHGPLAASVRAGERLRQAVGRSGRRSAPPEEDGHANGGHRGDDGRERGLYAQGGSGQRQKLKPWVSAATCIDWSLPCPSIFERERPLAEATLRRIAHGIRRYVIEAAEPFVVRIGHTGHGDGGKTRGIGEPLSTITSKAEHMLASPTLVQTGYGERAGQAPRVPGLHKPLGTTVDGQKHALVAAFLAKHYGGNETPGWPLDKAISTITTQDHHHLVASHLTKFRQGSPGVAIDKPAPTVTANGSGKRQGGAAPIGLVTSTLAKLRGTSSSADTAEPLGTISAQGTHHAEVRALLTKFYGQGGQDQDLRDPLHTIPTHDRFALVTVAGEIYAIADIGMRMLQPRELYRAQGFPDSYVIERGADGRVLSKAAQVRMCGNSVSPPIARAIVAANYSEHQALRRVA